MTRTPSQVEVMELIKLLRQISEWAEPYTDDMERDVDRAHELLKELEGGI